MRVLHINDHLAYKGGVEVYALSLIRSLRGRGLEVGFAFGSGDSEAHSPSFHVPSISSVSWGRHRQGRTEMDAVLQSYRPDVCHVHGVFNSGTLESCLDYGPTILHLHDYRYLCPSSGLYYRRGGGSVPEGAPPCAFQSVLSEGVKRSGCRRGGPFIRESNTSGGTRPGLRGSWQTVTMLPVASFKASALKNTLRSSTTFLRSRWEQARRRPLLPRGGVELRTGRRGRKT